MDKQSLTNLTTYVLLAVAGGVALTLPPDLAPRSASATQDDPDTALTMTLDSVIRDFRKTHPDFNVTLGTGNGHYAGNVGLTLGANDKPTYGGAGYKVATQWRDSATHPIAPHLRIDHAVGREVRLVNSPTVNNNPTLDTYDSTIGVYSATNKGPAPNFVTGATMPAVAQPAGMPGLVTEYLRSGAGTTVLNADVNCDKFIISNSHVLTISGVRRILCNDTFSIENSAKIELQAGASLSIWFKKDAKLQNNVEFNNNTKAPSRITIYNLGTNDFIVENSAGVYFNMVSPNGGLHVKNNAHFYGRYTGKEVTVDNNCGFHIDTNGYGRICGTLAADTVGSKGVNSMAGVTSASSFAAWYADTLGSNLSTQHQLVLTNDGSGVWEHHDDSFLPIDGRLFGNESMSNNFFFTLAATTTFTHHACDGRFVEFQGADDFWMHIDNRLVLDIGGVSPMQKQRIDVDRLGLVDGQKYRIDLFYAQRNPNGASFHLRTNLDLTPMSNNYTVSAGHD